MTVVDGEPMLRITGAAADALVWTALCKQAGRTADSQVSEVASALSAGNVPAELARRILRPSLQGLRPTG